MIIRIYEQLVVYISIKIFTFLIKHTWLITIPTVRILSRNRIRPRVRHGFYDFCGLRIYPLRLLLAVNEKKKRQRESRPSESTEFGRCGARIPRKRRHLIGEAYMEAFIRPKRECINSWANLFRNNRAKFRTAREISRVTWKKCANPHEIPDINVYAC